MFIQGRSSFIFHIPFENDLSINVNSVIFKTKFSPRECNGVSLHPSRKRDELIKFSAIKSPQSA